MCTIYANKLDMISDSKELNELNMEWDYYGVEYEKDKLHFYGVGPVRDK